MTNLINLRDTGDLNMKALFKGTPTLDEIHQAQKRCGFGANGFPQGVKIETLSDSGIVSEFSVVTFKLQGSRNQSN
jgi:hypothetical protein